MARFTHDGVEYEELGNGKVRVVGPAAGQPYSVTPLPMTPQQQSEEDRRVQDQRIQDQEADQRHREWIATHNPDGSLKAQPPAVPPGYRMLPNGNLEAIPGGPHDPNRGKADQDKASVRAEAIDKIKLARSLIDRSENGWFTTGFGSGVAGYFKGTPAYDLAQDNETLKNAGALTRIMEMSAQNGGKNPLTPLSNSDFQALSSSLSNLDPGQSDEQYQANVQRVIDLYRRAYGAAGGTDLEGDIDPKRKLPTLLPLTAKGGSGNGGGGSNGGGGAPHSVWEQTFTTPGGSQGAAPFGATEQSLPANPQMQAELDAYIQQNGRKIKADDLSRFVTDLYSRYGAKPGPGLAGYADATINALQHGGQINTNIPTQTVPLSWWERQRNNAVSNPLGAAAAGWANARTAGIVDRLDQLSGGQHMRALAGSQPIAYTLGEMAGSVGGVKTLGMLGRAGAARTLPSLLGGGAKSQFARDLGADVLYSGLYGANQGQDPLWSAGLGGAASVVGRGLGRFAGGLTARDTLNSGQRAVMNALPDIEATNAALRNAQDLGLPMSLADVSPEAASLTGAAIRRNPTVAGEARDALGRRNIGQIDRFRTAVSDNLGPLDNVPQRADEIAARARANAGPLYDQAYATPIPATSELNSLLDTPFGRQALGRSRTIAANERRSPMELGFALDDAGNVVLNPIPNDAVAQHLIARNALDEAQAAYKAGRGTAGYDVAAGQARIQDARQGLRDAEARLNAAPTPGARASVPTFTTQSLDYTKRGMDDILEQHRNPITGKLNLDEMGNSQNGVLRGLLGEMDRANPAYGQARATYAGPAGEREALYLGRQALTEQPDLLAIQVGRQTPERLDMMRLGARDRLVQGANELSNSTNPYRTLNTPAMEQRLSTLYGDDATGRLLAQRDAELKMANTSNSLIGNSMTAERQAADQAFNDESLLRPLAEGLVETTVSGAPTMTVLRRLAGNKVGDLAKLGFGKKGAAKAAQIADLALNLDPGATLRSLSDARALDELYRGTLSTSRRKYGGMFGRGFIPAALQLAAVQ